MSTGILPKHPIICITNKNPQATKKDTLTTLQVINNLITKIIVKYVNKEVVFTEGFIMFAKGIKNAITENAVSFEENTM